MPKPKIHKKVPPFQPGDIVYLKSHPKDKMTVETCYYNMWPGNGDKIIVICTFNDPKTKLKVSISHNALLLKLEEC
jgi:hypothetical protein